MNSNKFLQCLFKRLCEDGIMYCVLRNYESLPQNSGGSDVDMWVSKKHSKRLIEVLLNVSKEVDAKLVSVLEDAYCPKFCFLGKSEGTQFDIFIGNIPFQNNVMIEEHIVCANIKKWNSIYVLDEKLGNLMAFLKEVVNNGYVSEKYITPIYASSTLYNIQYLKDTLTCFSEVFVNLLYSAIEKHSIERYVGQLQKIAKKTLKQKSIIRYRLGKLRRLHHRPGYVIAILGTDGSGKSTIINAITPILNEAFHNGVIYNHLRPNWLPEIGVLLGKKQKSDKPIVVTNPHAKKPSGLIGSLLRWIYYMQDYIWGYLCTVWPKIHTKSKVFIFDRYYYDNYIDQRRARTSLPNWVLRIGEFFVPKPDLILCLGGDPKKIYERKPETSLEEVTRQTMVLHKFCDSHRRAIWIDTTMTPQESINASMAAILAVMSKRFADISK